MHEGGVVPKEYCRGLNKYQCDGPYSKYSHNDYHIPELLIGKASEAKGLGLCAWLPFVLVDLEQRGTTKLQLLEAPLVLSQGGTQEFIDGWLGIWLLLGLF